jgi:hypothetical protein
VSRVLALVSFDYHPGLPFFLTSKTHIVIARRCFLFRHHLLSLSVEGHSCSDNNTRSLLIRSLAQSVRSDVPADMSRSLPLVVRALRIVLNFSPQKAGTAAGRPAACSTTKGAIRRLPRRPPCCRRSRDAASDPPSHGRASLLESPRKDGKLVAPFIEIL